MKLSGFRLLSEGFCILLVHACEQILLAAQALLRKCAVLAGAHPEELNEVQQVSRLVAVWLTAQTGDGANCLPKLLLTGAVLSPADSIVTIKGL